MKTWSKSRSLFQKTLAYKKKQFQYGILDVRQWFNDTSSGYYARNM